MHTAGERYVCRVWLGTVGGLVELAKVESNLSRVELEPSVGILVSTRRYFDPARDLTRGLNMVVPRKGMHDSIRDGVRDVWTSPREYFAERRACA
jgi:hypothetical protein